MVDENLTLKLSGGERAAWTDRGIFDRGGIDDASEDYLAGVNDLRGASCRLNSPCGSCRNLGLVNVETDDAKAHSAKPLGEALPHQTEPDKSDWLFGHVSSFGASRANLSGSILSEFANPINKKHQSRK
jgi:hypothetical protein